MWAGESSEDLKKNTEVGRIANVYILSTVLFPRHSVHPRNQWHHPETFIPFWYLSVKSYTDTRCECYEDGGPNLNVFCIVAEVNIGLKQNVVGPGAAAAGVDGPGLCVGLALKQNVASPGAAAAGAGDDRFF